MPDCAASISAAMTDISEAFTPSRAPATMDGTAEGRITLRNRFQSEVPMDRAAFSSSGSTDFTPTMVLISRKNTAA